ncbi:MAG: hypothetical protein JO187_10270 [Acidobacteria bacterium]|nr:hypothetical protein [Acidobacteriaceae bacterium]MBV9609929.1 hypothetical protein [Acidobacteriota bacterium]
MRRFFFCVLAVLVIATSTCLSQQTEVLQYSAIVGYSYLETASLNLAQRGLNADFAQNVRPWVSLGMDFSYFDGFTSLLPSYLNSATQTRVGQALTHMGVPPSAVPSVVSGLSVPITASTFTYQAGPQFNYRRLKHVTLFVRPALGMLHIKLQTHPNGFIPTQLVSGLLGGKLSDADTCVFYGFGGGATWEITPHFGLRVTADLARVNFFSATLNGTRNGVRISVMPKVGFGKNIMSKY